MHVKSNFLKYNLQSCAIKQVHRLLSLNSLRLGGLTKRFHNHSVIKIIESN